MFVRHVKQNVNCGVSAAIGGKWVSWRGCCRDCEGFELAAAIAERHERMSVIATFRVFAVTALRFAAEPWGIRTDALATIGKKAASSEHIAELPPN